MKRPHLWLQIPENTLFEVIVLILCVYDIAIAWLLFFK
jgi:hypothetical protein